MQSYGSPAIFLQELIGYEEYLPELLQLILDVWPTVDFSGMNVRKLEPDITALLYLRLRNEIEQRGNVPFYIWPEMQDFDTRTGKQLTRSDFEFHPVGTGFRIADQKPYLATEAKCLRVTQGAKFRANTGEYLKEMENFVTDAKRKFPAFAVMLGYVMDGKTALAFKALNMAIQKSHQPNLCNASGIAIHASLSHPPHGSTQHPSAQASTGQRPIYHLILPF